MVLRNMNIYIPVQCTVKMPQHYFQVFCRENRGTRCSHCCSPPSFEYSTHIFVGTLLGMNVVWYTSGTFFSTYWFPPAFLQGTPTAV